MHLFIYMYSFHCSYFPGPSPSLDHRLQHHALCFIQPRFLARRFYEKNHPQPEETKGNYCGLL